MTDSHTPTNATSRSAFRCLSLDLEVGIQDGLIHAFAGVRSDTDRSLTFPSKGVDLATAWANLDDLADGAEFLLGHNLIEFDLPRLRDANPGLQLLRLPPIDTLRLSPLAFPQNPYHRLVKHYQDGQLKRGRVNDPELDARLALEVFEEQQQELRGASPDLLTSWHWLTSTDDGAGFDAVFTSLRRASRPSDAEAHDAIRARLAGNACQTHAREAIANADRHGWSLAYALAWLSVSGGNSVMPPWVTHQFPEAGRLVRQLRDAKCTDPDCDWCRKRHDARKELKRWFRFPDFRADEDGQPTQQSIVEAAMAGEHVLAILPTAAGKSLCYQLPALSRYDKTGALTVVISPLVALMADQVAGLEKLGIGSCVTINGLLSMPERKNALDRVRLGDASMLIVSPEQLRSVSVRRVLEQREIGAWVLDEAHCLSKWGHDFRPDYRYVGRFIRERAGNEPVPPVMCLTATAKPDVKAEILDYFQEQLGIDLKVFDKGAQRSNLNFVVQETSNQEKFAHIHQILTDDLPADEPGGAIVYCSTRRHTEEVAAFLQAEGMEAEHFHAGVPPETRKNVQETFIRGELRVIVATNAFGMGIDKPDVRVVIHADIPGSLENYLQGAGRAGRDQKTARCVLLYAPDDVERQFGMSARSRLTRREIHGVLRALRNLDRKNRLDGEVVATSGEILLGDEDKAFVRDSATDDTRVRTAVSWLEETDLLSREQNRIQVFPSSLRVQSVDEARAKLEKDPMRDDYRDRLLTITETLMDAEPDEGISTDELVAASGLTPEDVRNALHDLERLGIASNDAVITAFVHTGVVRSSKKRFDEASALEQALIAHMREAAPDLGKGESSTLHLRTATQRLKGDGHTYALPESLRRIVRSIAADGRGEGGDGGSLGLRERGGEMLRLTLRREWHLLEELAERRRRAAELLLDHLLACLPPGSRGTDLLAETTMGKLQEAVDSDMFLKSAVKDPYKLKLMDHALLWLHEQDVIQLNKGLTVFRPAMTIRLKPGRRGFAQTDFASLKLHYDEQVAQIHVMAEYVQRGLRAMADALRLAIDYFSLRREEFMRRWLPDREAETSRQTTPESWRAIVENLHNRMQRDIVVDDREQTNVLVLAGPGSGKTRTLVHRIAYLVRVKRENPRGILALAYNRHAAVEIRRRLTGLIGDDARGVTVLTCHAFAMRLVGASFTGRANRLNDVDFQAVLRQAVELLHGEGLPPDEADEYRMRLLAGFRWILVDEYQDIGPDEYELISALAGRTLSDGDDKLSLFAVGDDDQNIYEFNDTSVKFIRRFEADYGPKPVYLTDNYRSTAHIIAAANAVIKPARQRMKTGHPIKVNQTREKEPTGGAWTTRDPVAQGRVQILPAGDTFITQAQVVVTELKRLASLDPNWDWSSCAVVAREWSHLDPVRSLCGLEEIPVQMANEDFSGFWHLRETRALVNWLRGRGSHLVTGSDLEVWLNTQPPGPWNELLREAIGDYALEASAAGTQETPGDDASEPGGPETPVAPTQDAPETDAVETPVDHFIEWLAEWGRDARRRQRGLMLLTAHSAKGLEFDHVMVLDGNWGRVGRDEDADAARRLYYVAMTRARQTLALARFGPHSLHDDLSKASSVLTREKVADLPPAATELGRSYRRLSLRDVFLSFAGYRQADDPVHRAIANLSPDDPLHVRTESNRRELLDLNGTVVGQLAADYRGPAGMRCASATVLAIATWDRDRSEPEYRDGLRRDTWEVVVPELVFEPDS